MLRRLNPGVFGLVLMSVTLAGHGVEPFRSLKDGKVIITDVSCAARYRGLAKNTGQIVTLFALTNLWLARRRLLPLVGEVRP